MLRLLEQILGAAFLDDPSGIHDAEAVGDRGMHRHVVGDEDDRGADARLDFLEEAEDVLLHEHVERGGRFVGDDELGLADGGESDRDALAHAAGELMRKGLEHVGAELQLFEMASTRARKASASRPMWRAGEVAERHASPGAPG